MKNKCDPTETTCLLSNLRNLRYSKAISDVQCNYDLRVIYVILRLKPKQANVTFKAVIQYHCALAETARLCAGVQILISVYTSNR